MFRGDLLSQTAASDFIPLSVREQIGLQLDRLTPLARAFLAAAAVLGTALTFEQLSQVAQINEQEGLHALEELVHHGLFCEGSPVEEAQALDGYSFPGEMIREVVYQEAGTTRQRIMKQRAWLIMQEDIEHDQEEKTNLPHATSLAGYTWIKTRSMQGQRAASPAYNSSKKGDLQDITKNSTVVTRKFADSRYKRTNNPTQTSSH